MDRGETWTEVTWQVNRLPVPEDAEGRLCNGALGKLMVSSDEVDSWTASTDVPPNALLVPSSVLVRDARGRFYLVPSSSNLPGTTYFNDPGSSAWQVFPSSPSPNILQLAFDKRARLLAATAAGLYGFESE